MTEEFVKWPHSTQRQELDAHRRLLALIESEPFRTRATGHFWQYWFTSMVPGVEYVLVTSLDTQWVSTRVVREGNPDLVWEADEDIVKTARYWIGVKGDIPWHLVRDDDAIAGWNDPNEYSLDV